MADFMTIRQYWTGRQDEFSDRSIEGLVGWAQAEPLLPAKGASIIDLGCGIGNMCKYLTDNGYEAEGITYQEVEVLKAQELGRPYINFGDVHNLPFQDSVFDSFIMWDSLEHTISPFIALCEARRVTKRKGEGLIFIPSEDQWGDYFTHIIVPNVKQMAHLVSIAGLNLIKVIEIPEGHHLYQVSV